MSHVHVQTTLQTEAASTSHGGGGQRGWLPAPASAPGGLGLWAPAVCVHRAHMGEDRGGSVASAPLAR